jgi:hypothetical protein
MPADDPQLTLQANLQRDIAQQRRALGPLAENLDAAGFAAQKDRLAELEAQQNTLTAELAAARQAIAHRLHVLSPGLYAEGQRLLAEHMSQSGVETSLEQLQERSAKVDEQAEQRPAEKPPAEPMGHRDWRGVFDSVGRALRTSRAPGPAAEAQPADPRFREYEELAASWLKAPRNGR